MRNINSNLFNFIGSADVICITTNGYIKSNGEAVMGRGCALTAKTKFPDIPKKLASAIRSKGNIPSFLKCIDNTEIWSFPVKHNWYEKADINLIASSCKHMVNLADENNWSSIVIPRPGCGNGKLSYSDVEPILQSILDDRFYIITF